MPSETDIRLRSWLDSNQRDREQLCRAVLALDERYTDVQPRHPLGGRDGGRDIEAIYQGDREAYGAVGFVNGANESDKHKKQIRGKFREDIASAVKANPQLKAFVFLTNLRLTVGEQSSLKQEARKNGVEHCDIYDRERIRIELDSPSGFFIRFQYLSIPLSEAEQASFLARYGDQIQSVVTTGFQRVEKTLNRLLFLAEANDTLGTITFRFVLKQSYAASEIGHFRAFVYLTLREIKHDIFSIWFGTSDRADRFRDDRQKDMQSGIGEGISTGQWEHLIKVSVDDKQQGDKDDTKDKDHCTSDDDEEERFVPAGWSCGVGMDPVPAVSAQYRHDQSFIRYQPRLALRDIDDCSFLPFLNASLAEKLHSFQVYANGYKLADFGPDDFKIDQSECGGDLPGEFTEAELKDAWVRIRPAIPSSTFYLRFSETTPRRMFGHEEPNDNHVPTASN